MPSPGRTTLASKACDACRLRKVKCDLTVTTSASRTSLKSPDRTIQHDSAALRCRRCSRLDLPCTFDKPSKTRGPRKRSFCEDTGGKLVTAPVSVAHSQSLGLDRIAINAAVSPANASPLASGEGGETPSEYSDPGGRATSSYPTDGLCSRQLLKQMMDDYLRHLYPLIPIIHRPSFRRDLMNDRDLNDKVFLGLLLAMCAAVVGLMPSRFDAYRVWSPGPPLRFSCRGEMINYCHDRLMRLRDPQYFDKINFHKFAISYLMCISFFQLGDLNRARMMEVEAMQLGRLLHVHKISEYAELNCIEAQLRKKGFWLLFYTYVHSELQNLRREKLSFLDPISLSSMNLEELLPLEVDDEMIYEDSVLMPDQPGTTTSLTSAFIIHSRVFWAALLPTTKTRAEGDQQQQEMPCVCRRWRDLSANIAHLRGRLEELKYMLDSLPPQLLPWASGPTVSTVSRDDPQRIIDEQFAAMRANLHVTHLWLQSIIIDQLDAAVQDKSADASFIKKEYWAQREEISRQLLHLLHAIPEPDIEPNGLHLTFKVRDIAVGLLNCPYDEGHAAAKRAAEYIQQLTLILSRLDRSESPNMVNVQSWVDTDRIGQKGLTVGTSAVVAERAGYSGRGLGPVTTPVLEW